MLASGGYKKCGSTIMTLTGILNSGSVIVLVLPPPLSLSSQYPSSLLLVAVVALNQTPPHFTLDDGVSPCPQELRLRSVCPLPRPCPGPCSPLHFPACCLALPRYDCQPENVEENYISKRVLAVEGANRALLGNGREGVVVGAWQLQKLFTARDVDFILFAVGYQLG